MNIVKLKDKIKPGDDFFNNHLKGKYAWWIHMRFIVPFDRMGVNGYIACEEDLRDLYRMPYGTEFRDTYDKEMWEYIDQDGTDEANVINIYKMYNQYTTDTDITINQIKLFRTWLANEILKLDANNKGIQMNKLLTSTQTYILQYYSNNMYDEVVKRLSEISSKTISLTSVTSTCSCNNSINTQSIDSSDPILSYRKDVYIKMVEMFSNIDFWKQFPSDFLSMIKKYIDNIIRAELPLTADKYTGVYAGSSCSTNTTNFNILERFSVALEYMINGQITGHKNYINSAIYDWSSILYENLQWD